MDVIWMALYVRIDEWQGKLSSFSKFTPMFSHLPIATAKRTRGIISREGQERDEGKVY
jgi:hypothetical protein